MRLEPFGADSDLFKAVAFGDVETVRALNPSVEAINAPFSLGEDHGAGFEDLTLLMVAAGVRTSSGETVRVLLELGADPKLRSSLKTLAAWYACSGIPQAFIDKEILRDEEGDWYADRGGDIERLRILLDAGANPNEKVWADRSYLYEACERGDNEMVALLLERGAKAKGSGSPDMRPLCAAAEGGHGDCVRLLLGAGASIDQKKPSILAFAGTADVAQLLIVAGADLNGRGKWNEDVLDTLFSDGNLEAARVVLEAGASLESQAWGASRAHGLAGVHMNARALRLFIECGGRYDLPGYDGGTLLHTTAWQGEGNNARPTEEDEATLEYIIGLGVPVDALDKNGNTALHEAVGGDWPSPIATEVLLRHGANPNLVNRNGYTCLMLAAEHGSAGCVRLLLGAGADPKVRRGLTTALHLARQHLETFQKVKKDRARGKVSEVERMMESIQSGVAAAFGVDTPNWFSTDEDMYDKPIREAEECVRLLGEAMR